MIITIKDFCKGKIGVTYNILYGRCYRLDIQPKRIDKSKHYPIHYYDEKDLIKLMEIKY